MDALIASDMVGEPKTTKEGEFLETKHGSVDFSQRGNVSLDMVARISSHPVSVEDKQGGLSPSAFIPFCSFGAEMLGVEVTNMTFLMCNIFEPIVYHKQLCYQANVQQYQRGNALEGKENGLMLLKYKECDTS